jgi:hypothetical protein
MLFIFKAPIALVVSKSVKMLLLRVRAPVTGCSTDLLFGMLKSQLMAGGLVVNTSMGAAEKLARPNASGAICVA